MCSLPLLAHDQISRSDSRRKGHSAASDDMFCVWQDSTASLAGSFASLVTKRPSVVSAAKQTEHALRDIDSEKRDGMPDVGADEFTTSNRGLR